MQEVFWSNLESLIASSELVIDRPRGSAHPKHPSVIYPVDYGFLKGTAGGDGEGIDVWRGSFPDAKFDAVVCTVDSEQRDAEVKLLIGCSPDEKQVIVDFLNLGCMGAVLVERE